VLKLSVGEARVEQQLCIEHIELALQLHHLFEQLTRLYTQPHTLAGG